MADIPVNLRPRDIPDIPEQSETSATAALTNAPELQGLSESEAQARRARGLGNTAPPPTGRTYWQIIRENVFTFINSCLFVLGLLLLLLNRPGDALVSTGVILLNVLVSVVQEIRAKRTLDRVALLTRPTATVMRDERERTVAPEALVVGDVLKVGPGDQIVVDGRVIGAGRMNVDESQLTGESQLVPKQAGDQVFSGSFCVSGAASFVAEQVGAESFANKLTAGARAFRRVLTPLQREIYLVIRIMLLIVLYFEFLLVMHAVLRQLSLAQSVQNSTIIAGLVPNGLFLSISVAYAIGAVRIIRYGALVQQANAIESLSNVDVLCLDKTGTLTANRLQVQALHPIGGGEDELRRALRLMMDLATTGNKTSDAIASYVRPDITPATPAEASETAETTPEPMDGARLLAEIPFSSARKWSAVAIAGGEAPGVYALGAPEMLRPYLRDAGTDTSSDGANDGARPGGQSWQAIATQAHELADQGLRVLLVAFSPANTAEAALEDRGDESRLPGDMRALGLVSLSDELRAEAREALAAFRRAGVHPKIISGDNPETVAALARQAGLGTDIRLISGLDLEQMDEAQFQQAATTATVFGRITPQQKQQLMQALRASGHYVAMIGDGVNDVLSLKQANLGIAMQSGSQATRGVADIVLTQDSFAALVPAVGEGQRIINGMQDILRLFLTRIGTIGLIILSSLVIGEFPLALRQGSLVTLFGVGIPTVLLALWAQPGPTNKGNLLGWLFHFILAPVLITSIVGLPLFYLALYVLTHSPDLLATHVHLTPHTDIYAAALPIAQTILTVYLLFCSLFLIIFVEPPSPWWTGGATLSTDRRPTLLAVGLMLAFVLLELAPPLRNSFALTSLNILELSMSAIAVAIWLFAVRWAWRAHLISRFLGTHHAGDEEGETRQ
jgi:cation-transporting ATPase E